MRLNDALSQIADIRQQIARSQAFRGYRSLSTALTGVLAILAAFVQKLCVVDPMHHLDRYLTIWLITALTSIAIVGMELAMRCWRSDQPLQRELSFHAIEQMTPSLVAGALLTVVITQFCEEIAWALPGLWSILFGLGVFASRRLLPRPTFFVGGFYLLAGLLMISMRQKALAPWTMGATFSLGQLSAAALLYFNLERNSERLVTE
ncbi:MAG TPA: hypothetical protein VHS31_18790 [Tepidisphaeraceae bacterium]|jgi:hypothetical protein|nr:hypothetical protein [Tepidisphaeraceae bacterium]